MHCGPHLGSSILLLRTMNYSPLCYLVVIGLTCLLLLPAARAVTPIPDGAYPGQNVAEGGGGALGHLTTGLENTAIGFDALLEDETGNNNTAVGNAALQNNTADNNTAVGQGALLLNTTGTHNSAIGASALRNSNGDNNTANGFETLLSNTNGSDNTAVGYEALHSNGFDGMDNTAVGSGALSRNVSASFNTAVGFNALFNNTAGDNTAVGDQSLFNNSSGINNTATGTAALFKNTIGNYNTASGPAALFSNTTGSNNTADGYLALENNIIGHDNMAAGFQALLRSTGSNNIALGSNAGANLTTGNNNIDIGATVLGNAGEANTIRVGKQGTQKASFIAGIFGTAVSGSQVVVSSNGKLGVATSSARFKDAIKPMDKASETIFALKPVTFRYKEEVDPDRAPQFGLVAEDVEKVSPDLVIRGEDDKVMSVRYEAVNAMLLNEFLKEHRKVEEQGATIAEMKKQIAALSAMVQKVNE